MQKQRRIQKWNFGKVLSKQVNASWETVQIFQVDCLKALRIKLLKIFNQLYNSIFQLYGLSRQFELYLNARQIKPFFCQVHFLRGLYYFQSNLEKI
ncbi:unnamed protein product [Paramecium sonneborni]|uniref:Uncharacterized protein n=1 Tax=Paramecium sonneborni TaxID=65129 RepID=A0A8S1PRV7_9CILI|nr:unnamed protein product [Paramecium sonneborni]